MIFLKSLHERKDSNIKILNSFSFLHQACIDLFSIVTKTGVSVKDTNSDQF